MATKTHDIIADIGTYTDRNGEEKKRWLKVGALFDSMSIKIDAMPVGPEWSGWLIARPPTDFETQRPKLDEPPF